MQPDDPSFKLDARGGLDGAFGASGVGLWSWDVERDVVTWDETLCAIAGRTPTKAADYAALIHAEDRERSWSTIERAVATGEFDDLEHRWVRPDGTVRWVHCKGRAERDGRGRVVRLLGGSFDVTERRQHHERLLAATRLDSVGRLAGGIAHDFNNMLMAIVGSVSLVEQHIQGMEPCDGVACAGLDVGPIYGHLATLRRAAERSAKLTAQLLAFARKQAHEPRPLRVDQLIEDVARRLQPVLGDDVDVVLDLRSAQRVHGDPKQLEQVLLTLGVNARDAMPTGGTLTFRTRDVILADGKPAVRLSVIDTGIGIAPDNLGRVFEPFFTTKPPGMGTGLGLATCYGIVSQHRGTIAVESQLGRGTTFDLELPVAARLATEPRLPTLQPTPVRGAPATVLVVEDEELVRLTAVRGLELHGFRVLVAASGSEALEILRTTAVDLVLSDLVMPQMSGQELARAIREVWPGMKILFMSGYSEAELGGIELLQKPFTPTLLADRVKDSLLKSA